MKFYEEKGIAYCGLACVLCSEKECIGCKNCNGNNNNSNCDYSKCSIYKCCKANKLDGCYACKKFKDNSCEEEMINRVRIKAFNKFAQIYGEDELIKALKRNYEKGIIYHMPNGLKGDYDKLNSEEEIIELLKTGKIHNAFVDCPVYEADNLFIEKIKVEDAKDLFECYSDETTIEHMNKDNCGKHWDRSTVDKIISCINGWNKECERRFYIRWSVHNKKLNKVIGTIELAPIPNTTRFYDGVCKTGIFRIDLLSKFESKAVYSEIIKAVTDKFYFDFDIENIITKLPDNDNERLNAIIENGYVELEDKSIISYDNYYIKRNR